ncbi:flagellar basal body P-ring formation chaperone FlgA [Agarivorans albus]|uniref:Flagella basal body P-ring formation protein FlgA n=1 Tax=Agarivorans albus MKT 106 TaxID=1331007 RepID=R9PN32_AGAAL|nr:flagellar basal body P-ring formation chaperone FlgA [Agarivorans albus]GAD02715.1 flagellar basal-body P-ring formation protein FlgA [Agarivorans albus MKT 106]
MLIKIAASLVLFCFSLTAHTSELHSQLEKAAVDFVYSQITHDNGQKIELTANQLDERIAIPDCSTPYRYSLANGEVRRNTSVLVTCDEHANWRLYIPVRKQVLLAVVVAASPIQEGAALTNAQLTTNFLPENRLRGSYFTELELLVGAKLRRAMRKDQIITGRDICIICKGDAVTISANAGGLNVTTQGTALSSGTIGDTIRVRNNQSQRLVTGRVKAIGIVEVKL